MVGWECGLVGMWSWDWVFFMVSIVVAWKVFGDEWFWGIVCLTKMVCSVFKWECV